MIYDNIEKDYVECFKVIDLNEYRKAKQEMEDFAEKLFKDENVDEIINSLTQNTIQNNKDLPF